MSYAETYLRYKFDYGELQKRHPDLKLKNPDGSCFTMSCRWARELLDRPSTPSMVLARLLEMEIMTLAPVHSVYIKETHADLPQEQRNKGYVKVFRAFHLTSPTLTGTNPRADFVPSFTTSNADDGTDWMGLVPGDMWGAVYRWGMREKKPFAAILQDDKHAVGLFSNDASLRIWDMNAGEFLISDAKGWGEWSKEFEKFETTGGTLSKVEVIPVQRAW